MDRNNWYPQTHGYRPSTSPRLFPDTPPVGRVATDSVQDSHRLLALYPMASASPSTHVARHLSNLSIAGAAPSFAQPDYYALQDSLYPQGNPPPYTEYAHEINYLVAPHQNPTSASNLEYWQNTRDEAVLLVGEQPERSYPQYPAPPLFPAQASSYQTNAFAQSVFQRTAPSSSYPTPPPPSISTSSSSLAFALGDPSLQSTRTVYRPEQSADFFNTFLAGKTEGINASHNGMLQTQVHSPARLRTPATQAVVIPPDSPDPLSLMPSAPTMFVAVTPRKRKPVDQIGSQSTKRIQATPSCSGASQPSMSPTTPTAQMLKRSPKKALTMDYIEVPPVPWSTPTSSQWQKHSEVSTKRQGKFDMPDDLGGYGSDDDETYSPTRHMTISSAAKSSSRRTGGRDERAPLEKFVALLEDIFEAEDALPPDIDLDNLPLEFFSPLTVDCTRPMIHPGIIRKLTKYIGQVARPTKRLRLSARDGVAGSAGSPRSKGRMAEADTSILSRVLKMLDRSVKAGEDLDPFVTLTATRDNTAFPRKPAGKKHGNGKKTINDSDPRPTSQSPRNEEEDGTKADQNMQPSELTVTDVEKLTRVLDLARDSILAADCCIALFGSDRLTKQLYSEELITACLSTIKNQLTKVVYPFVEASAETNTSANPLLQHLVKASTPSSRDHRRQLSETFQALSAVLPRINNLVCAETVSMSDTIIIQAVYIAIGPFFVVESGGDSDSKARRENAVLSTLGKSAMRGLRLDALSLIRSIFANHEDQRSWIIEEILTSLIMLPDTKQKAGQFRLRDGRSIRTVSALLLQLVQTSAHDVRLEARKIGKARQQLFALRRQESFTEKDTTPESFLDENDMQEIHLYTSGLESAKKAAKTIVLFLTQRSGKGKATKNSNEAEYRTIFDNLISDLLAVLYWPEWPAASLLLSIACKYMVSSLDDVKTTNQSDNNAAKNIALDHLGVIAARIRSTTLNMQQNVESPQAKHLKPLDEILSNANMKELEKLLTVHQDVASHLCKRSSEDQAYDSARELTAATLGQELAIALKQVNMWILNPGDDKPSQILDHKKLLSFGLKLKNALRDVWKAHATDVFDIGSQEEVARIDRLAEQIGTVQALKNSFPPILNVILLALDAPPVFMRTKALRALGQIVTSDSSILSTPNVRRAIESHLLDSSPAVRDAAVELIGKYMIDSPEVAGDYYHKIADRIADTGLAVRKRVIKLLKSFYGVTEDNGRRVDISTRLVMRMLDEDDIVKDLAVKTVEELWFQNTLLSSSTQKLRSSNMATNSHNKSPLLMKVAVIMGVSANFKDRQSPLEDMLHKIMADKDSSEASSLHSRYKEICETLIDGLVDASDLPGFTVTNCIRTIHLFTSAYPAILSGSNASTLLPYLKNATTGEEQATSDYLLKIFRVSIPHMPKTAAKFGHELQLALQPMIIKPSTAGGVLALQETVACMCTVVQNLTHDFGRLVALVKSCNGRLQQAIIRPANLAMTAPESRALSILIFIVSLLGEYCDFDRLRDENDSIAADLNTITQGSIIEHIYDSLLKLYAKYESSVLRGRILQCLGFLFRAQPTLMTLGRSASIMDAIFASPEEEGRGRLLKILQDFLVAESAKHSAKEKGNVKGKNQNTSVNMEELVGNTDDFADSGVSSAVVQRYLDPILDAALSQNIQIQAAAIDVLSFTIKQGLAHPLQSFPVIVALETSPNAALSARANALHAILHTKHMSLLNTRYTISARTSFDYQRKICSGPVQGYRMQPVPTALLQRWYSLVREKRSSRQDFLKALVKVFDVNVTLSSSQDDIDFTRYMTENFAAFDYRTQEEVLTVIKYLTSVLSTTGMQLVESLSPSHLLSQLHGAPQLPPQAKQGPLRGAACTPSMKNNNQAPVTPNAQHTIPLMNSSVIIGMIMLLKAYLKSLYGLSEEKCSKFVSGKKTAVGDRPANKRHDKPILWERLPFATTPLLTTNDVDIQKTRFLDIWNEDGLTAEPEDDFP